MTAVNDKEETPVGHEDQPSGVHRPSHTGLLMPVPRYLPGDRQERLNLSAVVVPTVRPAGMGSGLAMASRFAEAKNAQLVVIRSRRASERPFQDAMVPRTECPTAVIDLPPGADLGLGLTSDDLLVAKLHRDCDLGLKRNLGLLLGRMCKWEAALLLDDDLRSTPASRPVDAARRLDPLERLGNVLADFATYPGLHAAGYFQRDMDDNSVVCHARRLVGRPQEIFISGGAMAVRVAGPLPFFSKAYNEDWLFLLPLIIGGRHILPSSAVRYVGTIHQDSYYPFTVPRARAEELGDLLAEGLFSLIGEPREDVLSFASSGPFWEQAIEQRCRMISGLLSDLYRLGGGVRWGRLADAEQALQAALSIYRDSSIEPAEAVAEFFTQLVTDQGRWSRLLDSVTPTTTDDGLDLEDAIDVLGLSRSVTWLGGEGKRGISRAS